MAYFGPLLAGLVHRVESWPHLKAGASTSSPGPAPVDQRVSALGQSSGFLQKLVSEPFPLASLS